jgi:hypothetical protein
MIPDDESMDCVADEAVAPAPALDEAFAPAPAPNEADEMASEEAVQITEDTKQLGLVFQL